MASFYVNQLYVFAKLEDMPEIARAVAQPWRTDDGASAFAWQPSTDFSDRKYRVTNTHAEGVFYVTIVEPPPEHAPTTPAPAVATATATATVPVPDNVAVVTWDGDYSKLSFKKLVRKHFGTERKIKVYVPHNAVKNPVNDGIAFNIWIWASPTPGNHTPPRVAYGTALDGCATDYCHFAPWEEAEYNIISPEGAIMGGMNKNNLFIYSDIVHDDYDSCTIVLEAIMADAARYLNGAVAPNVKFDLEDFTKLLKANDTIRVDRYKQTQSDCKRVIADCQKAIVEHTKTLVENEILLATAINTVPDTKAVLDRLAANPLVDKIILGKHRTADNRNIGKIDIFTKMITATAEGCYDTYYLGKFKLQIIDGLPFDVSRLTNLSWIVNDRHYPGSLYGLNNANAQWANLMATYNYDKLFELVVDRITKHPEKTLFPTTPTPSASKFLTLCKG